MSRVILHADMDAFYASVEQRDDPGLRGRPVVVGGKPPRGVVAAASYEARPFGIHSAMPTARAVRACPDLVVLPPRMSHYVEISQQIREIFERFSPRIEPLSLDEAFLDLSGTDKLLGDTHTVAKQLKTQVREETGLVVSVGVAPNKFIAKIASDLGKPDGLVVVPADEMLSFLHPLAISRLWGVGKVTERHLRELGVGTIGDLAAFPREALVSRFGQHGEHLWELACGMDDRTVVIEHAPKSVGQEDTFEQDIDQLDQLLQVLREQADRVAKSLRAQKLSAKVVVLKVKTGDFKTRTRRRTLPRPTSDGMLIGRVACELLTKLKPSIGPLRLTGVSAAHLAGEQPQQLSFDEPQRQRGDRLGQALDQIADKYGRTAITRGRPPKDTGPGRR